MVILSGLLFVLSFPPFPFAFLIYFAFVPLLLVIDETPPKTFEDKFWGFFKAMLVLGWRLVSLQFIFRFKEKPWIYRWHIISHNAEVFRYTYTAFVIWNFGCCYWLLFTGLDADTFSEPFVYFAAGLVGLLINPFLMSLPVYFYTKVRQATRGTLSGPAFICFWILLEWVHVHWDLAWPWLTLGHAMARFPLNVQYIEYTGVMGISLQILLINVLIYYALRAAQGRRWMGWAIGGVAAGVLALPFVLNVYLLEPTRAVFQPVDTLRTRIVQPNINPYLKTRSFTIEEQIERFVTLARRRPLEGVDLVVLPEKAIFKPLFTNCFHLKEINEPLLELAQADSVSVLLGAVELQHFPAEDPRVPVAAEAYRANKPIFDPCYPSAEGYIARYNAAFLLRPAGGMPQSIQKRHLVPMTEHVPFIEGARSLFEGGERPTWLIDDFSPADTLKTLLLPDSLSLGGVICYESLFFPRVRNLVKQGAQALAIMTDDGFWKLPTSQVQHASFARLRAIETRRELIRSANTGISMFVDVYGNVRQRTARDEEAILDRDVQLYDTQTYFVTHGDLITPVCAYLGGGLLLLSLLIQVAERIRKKKPLKGNPKI